MRKFLLSLGAIFLIALIVLIFNLDNLVKNRIERVGSRVAGVPVVVGDVDISLFESKMIIRNLVVANPPEFSESPAMRFSTIELDVDLGSTVVHRVYTDEPAIRVEGTVQRTNMDVLKNNATRPDQPVGANASGAIEIRGVSSNQPGPEKDKSKKAGKDKESGSAGPGDDEPTIYTINRIELEQARAHVELREMSKPVQLELNRLELVSLHGSRSEITRQIIDQLTGRILVEVEARLTEVAVEAAKAELQRQAVKLGEKARVKLLEMLE